jgi:hypothetical protein
MQVKVGSSEAVWTSRDGQKTIWLVNGTHKTWDRSIGEGLGKTFDVREYTKPNCNSGEAENWYALQQAGGRRDGGFRGKSPHEIRGMAIGNALSAAATIYTAKGSTVKAQEVVSLANALFTWAQSKNPPMPTPQPQAAAPVRPQAKPAARSAQPAEDEPPSDMGEEWPF